MGLINQANIDLQIITSNTGDFGVPVTFTSKIHGTIVTVNCLHNKINLKVDADGNTINSDNATVVVSEAILNAAGYVTRNTNGEVYMNRDLVEAKNNLGNTITYIVKSQIPDQTVGLITLILENYNK